MLPRQAVPVQATELCALYARLWHSGHMLMHLVCTCLDHRCRPWDGTRLPAPDIAAHFADQDSPAHVAVLVAGNQLVFIARCLSIRLSCKCPVQVTTFSVCPAPVAAAQLAGQDSPAPVAVLAAVTASGTVELVTLRKGALQPLHASISASLGDPCPRYVHFTCEFSAVLDLHLSDRLPPDNQATS